MRRGQGSGGRGGGFSSDPGGSGAVVGTAPFSGAVEGGLHGAGHKLAAAGGTAWHRAWAWMASARPASEALRTCWYFLVSLASCRLSAFFSSSVLVSWSCISCSRPARSAGKAALCPGIHNRAADGQGTGRRARVACRPSTCCPSIQQAGSRMCPLTCTVVFSSPLLGEWPLLCRLNMRLLRLFRPAASRSFMPLSTLTSPAEQRRG